MKKLLAIIITLALASCNATPTTPEFSDMYRLIDAVVPVQTANQTGYISIPSRFNPASGEITPLCADPLCSHGFMSGCPLEGYDGNGNMLSVTGNKVCFVAERRTDNGRVSELVSYDISSGTKKIAVSYEDALSYLPSGTAPGQLGFRYKMGYYYITLDDAETNEQAVLLRYDAGTDEITELDPSLNYGRDLPSYRYGDKYIYYGEDIGGVSNSFYISNSDTEKGSELLLSAEGIAIAFDDLLDEDIFLYATAEKNDNGRYDWENMTLHAFDMKSREERVLIDSIPDVYIASEGGYIYLVLSVEDPPYLGVDKNTDGEKYNRSGGKLWRVNAETGERDVAFAAPEYTLERTNIAVVGKYIIVGYRNTDYENYKVESTPHGDFYDYTTEVGRIVYDTELGTYAVYSEGEEKSPSSSINFGQ